MFNPHNGNVRNLYQSMADPKSRTVRVQTVAIFHPKIIRACESVTGDVLPIIVPIYLFLTRQALLLSGARFWRPRNSRG
jgi:hypothetical protein